MNDLRPCGAVAPMDVVSLAPFQHLRLYAVHSN